MVYDMGGGTLDVSLLNLNNGIFEVILSCLPVCVFAYHLTRSRLPNAKAEHASTHQ